jgi:hypothetical protein
MINLLKIKFNTLALMVELAYFSGNLYYRATREYPIARQGELLVLKKEVKDCLPQFRCIPVPLSRPLNAIGVQCFV